MDVWGGDWFGDIDTPGVAGAVVFNTGDVLTEMLR